jgi:hypothetical protein
MEHSPFEAWLDFVTMPVRLQQAMIADFMNGTGQVATSLAFGLPRRRSSAHLTLVSSNNRRLSQRSTAILSVVTK